MTGRAGDIQLQALRAFLFLESLRPDWGGALVLSCGLSASGAAFSIAANLAGAGFLAIEPQAEMARAALRSGACDFVVNSVDEALRILKNEIRKHKPVSVGLATDEAAALQQLIARGIAPEVFTAFDPLRTDEQSMHERIRAAEVFRQNGAVIANFDGTFTEGGAVQVESRLTERLCEQGLVIGAFTFGSADELRTFDSKLAETISPADFRRRWCLGAPRFFHRERPYRRVAALTAKERAHITP